MGILDEEQVASGEGVEVRWGVRGVSAGISRWVTSLRVEWHTCCRTVLWSVHASTLLQLLSTQLSLTYMIVTPTGQIRLVHLWSTTQHMTAYTTTLASCPSMFIRHTSMVEACENFFWRLVCLQKHKFNHIQGVTTMCSALWRTGFYIQK